MATPEFITKLRSHVGHEHLWLPGVTAIVVRPVPDGAPAWETPKILLVKRADNSEWTPVTGIIDPGEDPDVAAVREVAEETGLDAQVEAFLGTGAVGPVEYPNGDKASYLDVALRLSVPADAEPVVGDEESTEVGWFEAMHLPVTNPRFRLACADAVAQLRHPQRFVPRIGWHKHGQPGRQAY
ncbi:DNA mismatch repair protein MutT [Corynebacterium atypicum]|uniref:DNA mismatch repair protein MutT n=1 Tax=Corynebacterium atypicum TaxID=191610 RepID=A0ABM5QNS3_9CORY|nr:NUDIX domain-containing protein [Corynebacterium atypicum]AIG64469.1 DNA mismatch repair protein MutT [Corynebacterium atypicum]